MSEAAEQKIVRAASEMAEGALAPIHAKFADLAAVQTKAIADKFAPLQRAALNAKYGQRRD